MSLAAAGGRSGASGSPASFNSLEGDLQAASDRGCHEGGSRRPGRPEPLPPGRGTVAGGSCHRDRKPLDMMKT